MRNAESKHDEDELERITHSFVLKVWLETRGRAAQPAQWRGYITHVPTGERRYVQELSDIVMAIIPYLAAMDVHLSQCTRLWWWLYRQRARLKILMR